MDDKVLVSAIIPTYNRGHIVGRAIDSVLNQTYENIEVIVVDDGSADNTQAKLREYGDRVRLVCQSNAGPGAARNRGIKASRGEIIAFLDSDDLWLPTKLERQVSLLQRAPTYVPCCLCNGIQRRASGREINLFDNAPLKPTCDEGIWLNVTEVLANRFILFCQLVAIRRDALERTGCFDESMKFMEDYELELRLSLQGPWAIIRDPLAIVNATSADSLSLKASKEVVRQEEFVLKSRERVFATLRTRNPSATSLRHLKQAIRKARRDLWAARLRESDLWGVRIVGNLLKRLERYRMGIVRRSPRFPRVEAVPVERGNSLPIALSQM